MADTTTLNREHDTVPLAPCTWRRAVEIDADRCRTSAPCCDRPVSVTLAEMQLLGEVEVRCCGRGWLLRYDPWTPGRDALWIH